MVLATCRREALQAGRPLAAGAHRAGIQVPDHSLNPLFRGVWSSQDTELDWKLQEGGLDNSVHSCTPVLASNKNPGCSINVHRH